MKATGYWSALRPILLGWLIVLCLITVALAIVLHEQWKAGDALSQARNQLQQQQQQSALLASYQPDVHYFLAHRAGWQKFGLMRSPDFDHWDRTLIAMQQQFTLPHVAYEIQPTVSCTAVTCRSQWPTSQPPASNFTATSIQLNWSVSHESTVIDWLQQLEHAYAGLLLVRRCGWALAEGAEVITAQCDLVLFNFPNVLPDELIGVQGEAQS